MRFPATLPAAAFFLLSLSGCAKQVAIEAIDTSVTRYRAADLDAATLRESGVAVLPLTATDAENAAAAARLQPDLVEVLRRRGVCAAVLDPEEVRERFAREGVTRGFDRMIARLPQSGTLDREVLDDMGRATGCRFFLQANVVSGSSKDTADVRGVPHTSWAVTTEVHAQLWDAATGEVVWEGTGGGAALLGEPHFGSRNQTEWYASHGVANRLGQDPSQQPPPRAVADLHEQDHMQVATVGEQNDERANAALATIHVIGPFLEALAYLAH